MNYVDSILEPDERIVYRTRPSWTLYAPSAALAICALIVFVLGTNYQFEAAGTFIAAVLALAAIVSFVPAWFRRATTEIAVTDRRIILKRGFIRRHTVEMNMQKVETVDVDQTLIGRLFNFGNVTVRGTGSTFETIRRIDAPLKLRTSVTARS
ncbi:MAG TPA: PH domain-containing protein [Roseiarcus sp.]|nr:PH domain-containing protein [Roseiarcus sp.]